MRYYFMIIKVEVSQNRLDKFLAENTDFSRSTIKKMIEEKLVFVNGVNVKANYKVKENDVIKYNELPEESYDVLPVNIPIEIIYEDEDVLVVNKPSGMVVHPAPGHYDDTLVNALLYHIKDLSLINGVKRPGIVHRIDKETSGLLMVAKNDVAHKSLVEQLMDKTVSRKYVAIVHGIIPHDRGRINAPIGRDPRSRMLMTTIENGKEAVTHFDVLKRFADFSLIECRLETGRTHQIRVHMKYIGYPLLGDPQYGRRRDDFTHGQYLHAKSLGFYHPVTDEWLEFECDEPDVFKAKLKELEQS